MARFLAIGVVAALVFETVSLGAIRRVDDDAPVGGDGETWPTAYRFLRDALAASSSGDVIRLAQGVYRPDRDEANPNGVGAEDGEPFTLVNKNVTILGGYVGLNNQSIDPNTRDPALYDDTILSGDLLGNDDPGVASSYDDNDGPVVWYELVGTAGNLNVRLEGVVVSDGRVNQPQPSTPQNPGLFCYGASPQIYECLFMHNVRSVDGGGGGIQLFEHAIAPVASSPIIAKCEFRRNQIGGNGGGIYVLGLVANPDDNNPKIVNCKFYGNRSGHVGGGISFRDNLTSNLITLTNCAFIGNEAGDSGGGSRVGIEDYVRFVNCTFVANRGGFANDPPPPLCDTVNSGWRLYGGGGLSIGRDGTEFAPEARSCIIDNCIFWGNEAIDNRGNQIALSGVEPGIISGSYSDVYNFDDTQEFMNFDVDCDTIEDGVDNFSSGTGNIGQDPVADDPRFTAMPSKGLDGVWGTEDDEYGDVRLQYDSACIRAGASGLLPEDVADLDGDGVTVTIPGVQVGEAVPLDLKVETRDECGVEMGAYEWIPTCSGDVTGDGMVDIDDMTAVILNWGTPGGPVGDIEPWSCGDGDVDIDDLTAVILGWGKCTGGGSGGMMMMAGGEGGGGGGGEGEASAMGEEEGGEGEEDGGITAQEAVWELIGQGLVPGEVIEEMIEAGVWP